MFDRLNVIKDTIKKYGEENFYISFSGGKDSTILHYMVDMAIPGNQIPRVFIDTGIEYLAIKAFVLGLSANDRRFQIIKPSVSVKFILENDGYPFKSKQHSHNLGVYQRSGVGRTIRGYLGLENTPTKFHCPKCLAYQFTDEFKIKVSDKCCLRLKKEPIRKWEKISKRNVPMTGMRKDEGGERQSLKGCVLTDKIGKIKRFHPLFVVSNEFEEWFINKFDIGLCDLYYPPYNFKRTGCKGCPFSLDLQNQLDVMESLMPNEKKQCEAIWKPVYEEYRRLGYRLRKEHKNG